MMECCVCLSFFISRGKKKSSLYPHVRCSWQCNKGRKGGNGAKGAEYCFQSLLLLPLLRVHVWCVARRPVFVGWLLEHGLTLRSLVSSDAFGSHINYIFAKARKGINRVIMSDFRFMVQKNVQIATRVFQMPLEISKTPTKTASDKCVGAPKCLRILPKPSSITVRRNTKKEEKKTYSCSSFFLILILIILLLVY